MARLKRSLLCSVWAAALLATSFSLTVSSAAANPPGPDCENAGYNVETTEKTHEGDHKGVRAGTWFGEGNEDCNRISSLGALSSSGNGFVEYGWVLGYSSCADDGNQYYSQPRTFSWWRPDNGASDCNIHGSGPEGDFVTIGVEDDDRNGAWTAERSGNYVTAMNVGFSQGVLYVMGERDCTCDTAFAKFRNLRSMRQGNPGWNDWNDPGALFDNDPDFKRQIISQTEVHVVHD